MRRHIVILSVMLLAGASPAGASLDLAINDLGISFGNSRHFSGLRFNLVDNDVRQINGLNLTFWKPSDNDRAVYNGMQFGLVGLNGHEMNGIMLAGVGIASESITGIGVTIVGMGVEEAFNGIGVALVGMGGGDFRGGFFGGIGVGAESLHGVGVGLIGIGASELYGIGFGGIGLGGDDVRGIVVGGVGVGGDNLAGLGFGGIGVGGDRLTGIFAGLIGVGGNQLKGGFTGAVGVGGNELTGVALFNAAFDFALVIEPLFPGGVDADVDTDIEDFPATYGSNRHTVQGFRLSRRTQQLPARPPAATKE